jgi:hypothetical protein
MVVGAQWANVADVPDPPKAKVSCYQAIKGAEMCALHCGGNLLNRLTTAWRKGLRPTC